MLHLLIKLRIIPSYVNIVSIVLLYHEGPYKNQYPLIFHSSDKPFMKRYITRIKLKATANSSSKIYILQIQKQKKLQKYKITYFSKMQYISIWWWILKNEIDILYFLFHIFLFQRSNLVHKLKRQIDVYITLLD